MHVKFGALTVALALCLTQASFATSAVQWQPTLERAQVVAAHSNRLVLVHFWGNGCRPCAWMEREVFTRTDVANTIDQTFVAVKLNKDQVPGIARQFGIAAVPADVIMTPQGQVLASYVGQTPPAEFMNRLTQVAQRFAPATGPQPPVQARGAAPNAYAQNNTPPYAAMQSQSRGAANQPPSPYQSQPNMSSGYVLPAQPNPRYSDQYATGANSAGSIPGQQPALQGQGMPPAASAMPLAGSPAMSPANQPPRQPLQGPAAQNAAPNEANPPLALDGFCAVSLERMMRLQPPEDWKWVRGDPRWGIRHEGRTYLFAGPEEQQIFFSNPHFYAPVLSGNDAVLQVEQRVQVPGSREFGARWRDHVYLFNSRENFAKFQANPTFYENEIFGGQRQAVAGPGQTPGQPIGAAMNAPHNYR